MKILETIKSWYNGKEMIQEFYNDPNSSVWIAPHFYTEYHWTAKAVRSLVGFYLRHWQWLWGTVIGVASLIIAIIALK